jgi:hypothetical protein
LAAGGWIRPHTHPDERNSTVLKGVLYLGFGRIFDGSKLVAIPTGSVRHPADGPHYVTAKEGDVIYQEAGVGVTETIFLSEASSR